MKKTNTHLILYIVFVLQLTIQSCQTEPIPASTTHIPLQSLTLSTTPIIITADETAVDTISPIPEMQYQLTYVSSCQYDYDCIYSINIGCLEAEQLCLEEPQRVLKLEKEGDGPKPPLLNYDWAPHGDKIAVEATGINGKGDIFVNDLSPIDWRNLTNSETYDGSPLWFPDGLTIAFSASSGEPNYFVQLFSIEYKDTIIRRLLSNLDIYDVASFELFPNGKSIAFLHSDSEMHFQIFTSDLNGSNLRQLTDSSVSHGLSDISPDGEWLLYTLETEVGSAISNIFLLRHDGSEEINITDENEGYRSEPVWSPMGQWIAFTGNMDGNYDIYLIRSDGTGLTNVTQSTANDGSPEWRIIAP